MIQTLNSTSRLFLALWPEIKIQEALGCWRDLWVWPHSAELVPRESFHLTLHFLGNVPDSRLTDLKQGLNVAFQPFDLSFSHAQRWPHGVVVLEPDSVPADLLKLHTFLEQEVQQLGLPIEARRFRPHITLAHRVTGDLLPDRMQGPLIQWHIRGYALVQSQSAQAQAGEYKVLLRYEF